ncbi:coiled-coil domain-containing protein [Gordonia sp. MP11Mi]|uniref:Uncharacterized protein n=1 Tax=Gordonia sp. MP11Mi TaxID=3022769 RepID=A0AA97CXF2_9ACTN
MNEPVARAGWHAQHLQHGAPQAGKPASANTRGDRARLLKEAMRALDESDAARQAGRNSSIVAADTHLNTAYVNDGQGGLRELTKADGVESVLRYGDARIDAVKRKWHEKSFETTTIVSWVPKSLLDEVPDYYPVYSDTEKDPLTGEPLEVGRRSRWVMPQDPERRAEVQRWFERTHRHLTEDVLRGGHDAVHGVVWNFDESAVHVHWMCDTMAPLIRDLEFDDRQRVIGADGRVVMKYGKEQMLARLMKVSKDGSLKVAPEIHASQVRGVDGSGHLVDAEGSVLRRTTGEPVTASDHLRVEAQQMWGQSDEVTETRMVDGVEREVVITGATKSRRYQELYREQLVADGFDVALEANPEGTSLDKSAFAVLESRRTELDEREAALVAKLADAERRQIRVRAEMEALDEQAAAIEAAQVAVEAARKAADDERARARTDGYEAGRAEGLAEVEALREELATAVEDGRKQGYDAGYAEGEGAGRTAGRAKAKIEYELKETRLAGREAAVEAWETETAPALRAEIRAEVETAMQDDRAEAKRARDEAERRLAEIPDYDADAAVESMQAARYDAGWVVRTPKIGPDGKPQRDGDGKAIWVAANDEIDKAAERIYNERRDQGTQDQTVAEAARAEKDGQARGRAQWTQASAAKEQSKTSYLGED